MANKNEKKEQKAPAAGAQTQVDNIEEQIKSMNTLGKDHFDKAAEEIKKQREEVAVSEARKILARSEYVNGMFLINLRFARKKEKLVKEFLDKSKTLLDETIAGKYTKQEHDKAYNEAHKEYDKKYSEIGAERKNAINELKRNFNTWECWSWDENWDF